MRQPEKSAGDDRPDWVGCAEGSGRHGDIAAAGGDILREEGDETMPVHEDLCQEEPSGAPCHPG